MFELIIKSQVRVEKTHDATAIEDPLRLIYIYIYIKEVSVHSREKRPLINTSKMCFGIICCGGEKNRHNKTITDFRILITDKMFSVRFHIKMPNQ